jgi:predicted ester cyclase
MSEEHTSLVRRYYEEAVNAGDVEAIDRFFRPDLAERVKAGCAAYLRGFPDLHSSLDEVVAQGDTVMVRGTITGTHDGLLKGLQPTGRRVAIEFAESYRIRDGVFVGYWCLADVAGLMRQLTAEAAAASAATA